MSPNPPKRTHAPMQLHYLQQGTGFPLIIVHGLFGSSDNWRGQMRLFAEEHQVFALDLRNHGRSPWRPDMDFATQAADLEIFMDEHQITAAHILGHSLGGKVAMQLALNAPQRVQRLVVVDIAPVAYPPHHDAVFAALKALDLARLTSRGEADKALAAEVKDPAVRQFLLKNLKRGDSGYCWQMNLDALSAGYSSLMSAVDAEKPFRGLTLFIKGSESDYITEEARPHIQRLFPQAEARIMQGCGHWPHAEKPRTFARLVKDFLGKRAER